MNDFVLELSQVKECTQLHIQTMQCLAAKASRSLRSLKLQERKSLCAAAMKAVNLCMSRASASKKDKSNNYTQSHILWLRVASCCFEVIYPLRTVIKTQSLDLERAHYNLLVKFIDCGMLDFAMHEWFNLKVALTSKTDKDYNIRTPDIMDQARPSMILMLILALLRILVEQKLSADFAMLSASSGSILLCIQTCAGQDDASQRTFEIIFKLLVKLSSTCQRENQITLAIDIRCMAMRTILSFSSLDRRYFDTALSIGKLQDSDQLLSFYVSVLSELDRFEVNENIAECVFACLNQLLSVESGNLSNIDVIIAMIETWMSSSESFRGNLNIIRSCVSLIQGKSELDDDLPGTFLSSTMETLDRAVMRISDNSWRYMGCISTLAMYLMAIWRAVITNPSYMNTQVENFAIDLATTACRLIFDNTANYDSLNGFLTELTSSDRTPKRTLKTCSSIAHNAGLILFKEKKYSRAKPFLELSLQVFNRCLLESDACAESFITFSKKLDILCTCVRNDVCISDALNMFRSHTVDWITLAGSSAWTVEMVQNSNNLLRKYIAWSLEHDSTFFVPLCGIYNATSHIGFLGEHELEIIKSLGDRFDNVDAITAVVTCLLQTFTIDSVPFKYFTLRFEELLVSERSSLTLVNLITLQKDCIKISNDQNSEFGLLSARMLLEAGMLQLQLGEPCSNSFKECLSLFHKFATKSNNSTTYLLIRDLAYIFGTIRDFRSQIASYRLLLKLKSTNNSHLTEEETLSDSSIYRNIGLAVWQAGHTGMAGYMIGMSKATLDHANLNDKSQWRLAFIRYLCATSHLEKAEALYTDFDADDLETKLPRNEWKQTLAESNYCSSLMATLRGHHYDAIHHAHNAMSLLRHMITQASSQYYGSDDDLASQLNRMSITSRIVSISCSERLHLTTKLMEYYHQVGLLYEAQGSVRESLHYIGEAVALASSLQLTAMEEYFKVACAKIRCRQSRIKVCWSLIQKNESTETSFDCAQYLAALSDIFQSEGKFSEAYKAADKTHSITSDILGREYLNDLIGELVKSPSKKSSWDEIKYQSTDISRISHLYKYNRDRLHPLTELEIEEPVYDSLREIVFNDAECMLALAKLQIQQLSRHFNHTKPILLSKASPKTKKSAEFKELIKQASHTEKLLLKALKLGQISNNCTFCRRSCNLLVVLYSQYPTLVKEAGRVVAALIENSTSLTFSIEREQNLRALQHQKENIRKWPTIGAIAHADDGVPDLSSMTAQDISGIPDSWTVISLSIDVDQQLLRVMKRENMQDNVVLILSLVRFGGKLSSIEAKAQLNSIVAQSDSVSRSGKDCDSKENKQNWWKQRRQLDEKLCAVISSMETEWLGLFRTLLRRRDKNTQNHRVEALLEFMTSQFGAHNSADDLNAIEIPVDCSVNDATDLYRMFYSLSKPEANEKDHVRQLMEFLNDLKANFKRTTAPDHIVLVVDRTTQMFPWESMPMFRDHSVSRVPSIAHLKILLEKHAQLQPKVESVSYILNPSGDLIRTQERFEKLMTSETSWRGSVGKAEECGSLLETYLQESDIVLYFGHGGGEQYLRGDRVRGLKKCAVTFLAGCSSAKLADCGDYDPYGTPLDYLIASSPCVVGNLWDVTDGEIDRLTLDALENWGLLSKTFDDTEDHMSTPSKQPRRQEKQMSLAGAICAARDRCVLRYLTGAAPVVYGLPVFLKNAKIQQALNLTPPKALALQRTKSTMKTPRRQLRQRRAIYIALDRWPRDTARIFDQFLQSKNFSVVDARPGQACAFTTDGKRWLADLGVTGKDNLIIVDGIHDLLRFHSPEVIARTLEKLPALFNGCPLILSLHGDCALDMNKLKLMQQYMREFCTSQVIVKNTARHKEAKNFTLTLDSLIDLGDNSMQNGVCVITIRRKNGKVIEGEEQFVMTDGLITGWKALDVTSDAAQSENVNPIELLPFNLTLTSEQQNARSNVQLPYMKAQETSNAGQPQIFYEPDDADDFDDEDPDADLDL